MQVNSDLKLCQMVNGKNTAGLTDLWYLPAVTHFWSQTRQTMGKLSFASATICAGASFCPFANIKKGGKQYVFQN